MFITRFTLLVVVVLSPGFRTISAQEVSLNSTTAQKVSTSVPLRQPNRQLVPVLKLAADQYKYIDSEVNDYTCLVIRQERVNGRLRDHEFMVAKVRNRKVDDGIVTTPFGVYLKFLKPTNVKGREVLYVEGQNDGEMFARRGGSRFAFVTTRLRPDSALALKDNRYPVTEFGVKNLVQRLIEAAKDDLYRSCTVSYLKGAKINDRPCQGFVITHPDTSEGAKYHQVRVFVDDELNIPVHYEAFDWPDDTGKPLLLEKYTYTKIRINNGFTDADFDPDNPSYRVK